MSAVRWFSEFEATIPQGIREQLHAMPYAGRVALIPVRPAHEMRGFLRGMNTTIDREDDRL
jgi:hypothetical protein